MAKSGDCSYTTLIYALKERHLAIIGELIGNGLESREIVGSSNSLF